MPAASGGSAQLHAGPDKNPHQIKLEIVGEKMVSVLRELPRLQVLLRSAKWLDFRELESYCAHRASNWARTHQDQLARRSDLGQTMDTR
eukprot:4502998-Pyramimonas_sp.AAC.1